MGVDLKDPPVCGYELNEKEEFLCSDFFKKVSFKIYWTFRTPTSSIFHSVGLKIFKISMYLYFYEGNASGWRKWSFQINLQNICLD